VQPELHERARLLLDRSMMEFIPAEKQRWLDHHLSECAECSRHAELNRRAIQALDSFAFDLDHAAALRVQAAVTRRAVRMRSSEPLAVQLAIALTIAGSFVMWPGSHLVGRAMESAEPRMAVWFCSFLDSPVSPD